MWDKFHYILNTRIMLKICFNCWILRVCVKYCCYLIPFFIIIIQGPLHEGCVFIHESEISLLFVSLPTLILYSFQLYSNTQQIAYNTQKREKEKLFNSKIIKWYLTPIEKEWESMYLVNNLQQIVSNKK